MSIKLPVNANEDNAPMKDANKENDLLMKANTELDNHIKTMKARAGKAIRPEVSMEAYRLELECLKQSICKLDQQSQLACLQATNKVVSLFNKAVDNSSPENIADLMKEMVEYEAFSKDVLEKAESSRLQDFALQCAANLMIGLGLTGTAIIYALVLSSVALSPIGSLVVAGVSLALCIAGVGALLTSYVITEKEAKAWGSVNTTVHRISELSSSLFNGKKAEEALGEKPAQEALKLSDDEIGHFVIQ